jgi:flagellar protein FliO/FliZ
LNSTADIWVAFARTFSVLFVVLAVLILVFYLIKKISTGNRNKTGSYIKVLGMHHLSPKEKLVLLDVLGETILVGVTPHNISTLSTLKTDMDFSPENALKPKTGFSQLLARSLGRTAAGKKSEPEKELQDA